MARSTEMIISFLTLASSIGRATNSGSDGCKVINLYNMGHIKFRRSSVKRMRLSVQNYASVQTVPQLSKIVNSVRVAAHR